MRSSFFPKSHHAPRSMAYAPCFLRRACLCVLVRVCSRPTTAAADECCAESRHVDRLCRAQVWRINPLQTAECVEKLERFMRLSAEARKVSPARAMPCPCPALPVHALPCPAMPVPCPCHALPCHAMPCRIGYARCPSVTPQCSEQRRCCADAPERAVDSWVRFYGIEPPTLRPLAAVGFVRRSFARMMCAQSYRRVSENRIESVDLWAPDRRCTFGCCDPPRPIRRSLGRCRSSPTHAMHSAVCGRGRLRLHRLHP